MKFRIRPGAASLSVSPVRIGLVNDIAQGRTVIYLCRWPLPGSGILRPEARDLESLTTVRPHTPLCGSTELCCYLREPGQAD